MVIIRVNVRFKNSDTEEMYAYEFESTKEFGEEVVKEMQKIVAESYEEKSNRYLKAGTAFIRLNETSVIDMWVEEI